MNVRGGVGDLLNVVLLQVSPAPGRGLSGGILVRVASVHALFREAGRVWGLLNLAGENAGAVALIRCRPIEQQ